MKFMWVVVCHLIDCLTIIRRHAIWSMHNLLVLNTACSSLSCLSTLVFRRSSRILGSIFEGNDSSCIPLQLLQSLRSPFLGSFTMMPDLHSSGILFSSHICLRSICITSAAALLSALSASGGMLSAPGAFPDLIFEMALWISSMVMGLMFASRSSPALMSGASCTFGPFSALSICQAVDQVW